MSFSLRPISVPCCSNDSIDTNKTLTRFNALFENARFNFDSISVFLTPALPSLTLVPSRAICTVSRDFLALVASQCLCEEIALTNKPSAGRFVSFP